MQQAVRRKHARRLEPDLGPLQIRKRAAGFPHDHGERGDVENVHVRLDHDIE